jgi:hypothetical protein
MITDKEGLAYTNAVQRTVDLMVDSDVVTIGELKKILLIK